jgi:hypothetical protein
LHFNLFSSAQTDLEELRRRKRFDSTLSALNSAKSKEDIFPLLQDLFPGDGGRRNAVKDLVNWYPNIFFDELVRDVSQLAFDTSSDDIALVRISVETRLAKEICAMRNVREIERAFTYVFSNRGVRLDAEGIARGFLERFPERTYTVARHLAACLGVPVDEQLEKFSAAIAESTRRGGLI